MQTLQTGPINMAFKTKMGSAASTELNAAKEVTFSIHGEVHTIKASKDINPETSLNTYLRNHAGLHGTKGMCYEGGCGACVVAVTFKHPVTKKERTFAVNSCLIPILSCHGWNISTVEGIGNRKIGYHPIQQTLAKFNGTQCGFCSGGMVMNMYALYESNNALKMNDVENAFGGSLCRCTGYRPIMDAFKSMTTDADKCLVNKFPDIEDIKICSQTGKKCAGSCKPVENKPVFLKFEDNNWYKVYSIEDILELFQTIGDAPYRFVAGNTGKGVYKIMNRPEYWIDILSVPDLISHKIDTNLVLGANVSLTDTMSIFDKLSKENPDFWYLEKVYHHLDVVANVPVRNAGTLAGNLSMKHEHHEFPSDIYLLLETCKAQLTIVEKTGTEVTKSILDYLEMDMNKCVLKSITLPPLSKDKHLFESYKICPRVQNAHAYVNAAFLVEHDGNHVVKNARILFGGIDPDFTHAKATEEYLVGKNLSDNATLRGALEKLSEEIKPDFILPDAHPDFRKGLSLALFYKFVLASIPNDKINPKFVSGGSRLVRALSTGKQEYDTYENMYPVTKPISKLEALIQCSGEAQYVNDLPPFPGEVFGALVLAEAKPFSMIKNVDLSEAMKMPGFVSFVDHKDIPGVNSFTPPHITPTNEQLFCVDKVLYNGQPIGVIVANTHQQAIEAAQKVKVSYEEGQEKPVFTIKEVLKNKMLDRLNKVTDIQPKRKGTDVKGVIKGHFEIGGQYHFHMETQSCICVPTDDGCYDLFAATQWMDHAQAAAARALNLPMNKINVSVKRLGGAYGGKIVRASLPSTACAIASHKLLKPVRLSLSLVENMKVLGKRVPTSCDYEVGYDDKGTIQYMNNNYYQDYGLSGMNEPVTMHISHFLTNSYDNSTWALQGSMIQTDLPGNSYCRAPGSTEAVAMIESIMEHIAQNLKKDPIDVKLANIQKGHEMESFIKEMRTWSDYDARSKAISDFNSKNRWMKKGISLTIMEYPFVIFGPYSSFVSIYSGDGTVSVSHGGVEMGQGINTKVAQVCAYTLGIDMEMVSIKPSNCLNAPNNMATGGSITSEAVSYATMQACKEILKRLEPVKAKMNNPTWKELVLQGARENVELCATHMFSAASDVKPYNILGACVTEIDLDVLTGEHNIVRVDLIEDTGHSMSPEIDIGQIEGAFVMGMGYYTSEALIYDDKGQLLTNSTWTYKVPGVKDIPADFRVQFKKHSDNPQGVLHSKATAEPPLCLSIAVPLAIRNALASARADADKSAETYVPIEGPTSVEFKFQNCLNDYKKYSL